MSFADVGGADPLHVFEDAVDGLLNALRGGARDVMGRLERLEVETVRQVFADGIADKMRFFVRKLHHLGIDVELAVEFTDEAVFAKLRDPGENRLHVAGAEGFPQLVARTEDGIEGVGAERTVFILQCSPKSVHHGLVGGLPGGEHVVSEPGGHVLARALDRDVAHPERRRGGYCLERIYCQWHLVLRSFRDDYTKPAGRLQLLMHEILPARGEGRLGRRPHGRRQTPCWP